MSAEELAHLLKENFRLDIGFERKYAESGPGTWVEATVTLATNAGEPVMAGTCEVEVMS